MKRYNPELGSTYYGHPVSEMAEDENGDYVRVEDLDQWQPIESCPKDGNAFLAGRWNRDNTYWWVFKVHWANGIIDGGWDGAREPTENPCTHWMPLPSPPQRSASDANQT